MDEISTGLDSSTTHQITKILANFTHMRQATVLLALLQPAPEARPRPRPRPRPFRPLHCAAHLRCKQKKGGKFKIHKKQVKKSKTAHRGAPPPLPAPPPILPPALCSPPTLTPPPGSCDTAPHVLAAADWRQSCRFLRHADIKGVCRITSAVVAGGPAGLQPVRRHPAALRGQPGVPRASRGGFPRPPLVICGLPLQSREPLLSCGAHLQSELQDTALLPGRRSCRSSSRWASSCRTAR